MTQITRLGTRVHRYPTRVPHSTSLLNTPLRVSSGFLHGIDTKAQALHIAQLTRFTLTLFGEQSRDSGAVIIKFISLRKNENEDYIQAGCGEIQNHDTRRWAVSTKHAA